MLIATKPLTIGGRKYGLGNVLPADIPEQQVERLIATGVAVEKTPDLPVGGKKTVADPEAAGTDSTMAVAAKPDAVAGSSANSTDVDTPSVPRSRKKRGVSVNAG